MSNKALLADIYQAGVDELLIHINEFLSYTQSDVSRYFVLDLCDMLYQSGSINTDVLGAYGVPDNVYGQSNYAWKTLEELYPDQDLTSVGHALMQGAYTTATFGSLASFLKSRPSLQWAPHPENACMAIPRVLATNPWTRSLGLADTEEFIQSYQLGLSQVALIRKEDASHHRAYLIRAFDAMMLVLQQPIDIVTQQNRLCHMGRLCYLSLVGRALLDLNPPGVEKLHAALTSFLHTLSKDIAL